MNEFLAELKRRNVLRIAAAYAVTGWLLIEAASVLLPTFGAPQWLFKAVAVVVLTGFPVAVILAWIFELTPDGIKRDDEVDRSQSISRSTGRKLDFVIIGLLSVALIYFVVNHDWAGDNNVTLPVAAADGPPGVAVLPFDNLSDNEENAYFTSGIHEDILTHLSRVADLRVISRTSVRRYTQDRRDLKTIAAELGVGHIVEGSVQRYGNKVRITAQLIDAATDSHLWAQNYDRDLTDVFAIQSEVARQIVRALNARLAPDESDAIDAVPSNNLEAYDLYLQAREVLRGADYGMQQMQRAEALLQQAIALDPGFAQAHAQLALVYTQFYWLSIGKSPELLVKAQQAIDRALAINPESAEAHVAQAEYYYRGFRDFARARIELERALQRFPGNVDVLTSLGLAYRRLGEWDKSIDSMTRVTRLDPHDLNARHVLCETLIGIRRWARADRCTTKLIADHPDDEDIRNLRANFLLSGLGDIDAAAELVGALEEPLAGRTATTKANILVLQGKYDEALQYLDKHADLYRNAPGYLQTLRARSVLRHPDSFLRTRIQTEALDVINELASRKTGIIVAAAQAFASAQGGDHDKAIGLARSVLEKHPEDEDKFSGLTLVWLSSLALAHAGEPDEALDHLERMSERAEFFSYWDLQLDPDLDILRDHPRFQTLLSAARARHNYP